MLGFFLLIAGGCNQNKSTTKSEVESENIVILKGTLEGGQGQRIIFEEMAAREFIPIDTAVCNDSGAFEISFSPNETAFYVLRCGPSGYVTLLLEPGESIGFSGSIDHLDSYQINGSEGSELLQTLSHQHKDVLNALGEITRKNTELVSSPDYSSLKQIFDQQFDSITGGFHQYSTRFIYENSGSLAILVALYNLYGQGLPVFYPDKDFEVYQYVDSALMARYSGSGAVDLLNAQVKQAKTALTQERSSNRFEKGEIAPDFVSSRSDGSQLALSDLKGEFVLLSFWAGWSRLSRVENPFLKEANEVYGKYPFRILQVSFDDNLKIWTGAIREDGLEWDHVSDLKRWDSPVADLYQVEKIPSNVLIDQEGKILEIDIFGTKLLDKLETLFKK